MAYLKAAGLKVALISLTFLLFIMVFAYSDSVDSFEGKAQKFNLTLGRNYTEVGWSSHVQVGNLDYYNYSFGDSPPNALIDLEIDYPVDRANYSLYTECRKDPIEIRTVDTVTNSDLECHNGTGWMTMFSGGGVPDANDPKLRVQWSEIIYLKIPLGNSLDNLTIGLKSNFSINKSVITNTTREIYPNGSYYQDEWYLMFDRNDLTNGRPEGGLETNMYFNITKKAGYTNHSIWYIMRGNAKTEINTSMKDSCLNAFPNKVYFRLEQHRKGTGHYELRCWDGSSWFEMATATAGDIEKMWDTYFYWNTSGTYQRHYFMATLSELSIHTNGTVLFNHSNDFIGSVNRSLDLTVINKNLVNCDGDNYINDGVNCHIPLLIATGSGGILEVELLNASYSAGIDDCSVNTVKMMNISLRNEKTNALVKGSGTFVFSYHPQGNSSDIHTYATTKTNQDSFVFCKKHDTDVFIGDMSHTFNSSGYELSYFNRISVNYDNNFTSYILPIESTSSTILYVMVDAAFAKVEGAVMSIYRVINGTSVLVFQGSSDFAGQISLVQDQTYEYFYNITHPQFPLKEFNLKPVLTSYTIKLTEEGDNLYNPPYSGIRYKIEPGGTLFNLSEDYLNFTFTLEGNNLEYWGINLTRHDFLCHPTSCSNISTSANGGVVTIGIKLNETGRFYISLFFKRTGEELVYINNYPAGGAVFTRATRSLVQMFSEIKDNTTPKTRAVIVGVVQAIFIGIAASLGISGFPLVAIASVILIFFSFPTINFIHPAFGLFIGISGIIAYIMVAARGQ